ncbi:MAG: ice-binding family protein [Bryobacteraceae bacterium]
MKKLFLLCATIGLCGPVGQTPVPLGSDSTFTILAGSTVTSTGPTVISGNLGLSPGTAVSGFPPGTVINGAIHIADSVARTAQIDLTTAYNNAAGRLTPTVIAGDLGGSTLNPGLYQSSSSIGITGTLFLNGQGNTNSVFIFQIGTALTTASSSQIVLEGGAQAANIFWQIGSSATLGTTSVFQGTIMAQASITLTTGASLNGRALARTGAVTLQGNSVINPGASTTGPPGPLSVACPSPTAQIGAFYNSFLSATGGTPPYTFSITGAVTGTVSNIGATPFGISVTDSVLATAANSCTISAFTALPGTPAPSSLILVLIGLIGLACTLLYRSRKLT